MLENGLQLSAQPAELTGILRGALLVITIALGRFSILNVSRREPLETEQGLEMKNSQVAVLSAVILAAAMIVAGSNWWLVRSLREELRGPAGPGGGRGQGAPPGPTPRA